MIPHSTGTGLYVQNNPSCSAWFPYVHVVLKDFIYSELTVSELRQFEMFMSPVVQCFTAKMELLPYYIEMNDVYEPIEEGLDVVTSRRYVSLMTITLSSTLVKRRQTWIELSCALVKQTLACSMYQACPEPRGYSAVVQRKRNSKQSRCKSYKKAWFKESQYKSYVTWIHFQ